MTSRMSAGITPYDFVQQVYYMQEKTLLDFWPSDDKYREVLVEANLVLRELEAVEDWTWLRETIVFGCCDGITNDIVEFSIPSNVYKLSTLHHDCLRLHRVIGTEEVEEHDDFGNVTTHTEYVLDEVNFIPVPISSSGDQRHMRQVQVNGVAVNHIHDYSLKAVVHGDKIMFNRRLTPFESNMVLVGDVQMHIKPFHVCTQHCWNNFKNRNENNVALDKCADASDKYLLEIPDPNYVIMATAARHAEGSPPALARVAGLQDAAQRILSQMRQNDAAATDADWLEWDVPGYIEVI